MTSTQSELFVVLGKDPSEVSKALRAVVADNFCAKRSNYYTLIASAKAPPSTHRFIEDPMVDGAMSLNGNADTVHKLNNNPVYGNIYHKPVCVIVHATEAFIDQDHAYDVLMELQKQGCILFVGGRENTLLIEKLVFEAQRICLDNVTLVRS